MVIDFAVRLPVITEEPSNKELQEGYDTTLSIKTQLGQILDYRWLRDCAILKEDDHYRGVATPCLSITNATPSHTGQYWCEVSNEGGSVSSTPSQLSVSKLTVLICSTFPAMHTCACVPIDINITCCDR